MIRLKTTLNFVIVFSVLFGLVFVIGCGNSKEEQKLTDFLKLYSDTVDQYATADEAKKSRIESEIGFFWIRVVKYGNGNGWSSHAQ